MSMSNDIYDELVSDIYGDAIHGATKEECMAYANGIRKEVNREVLAVLKEVTVAWEMADEGEWQAKRDNAMIKAIDKIADRYRAKDKQEN